MKKKTFSFLAVSSTILACSIPSTQDIHITECMRACNETSRECTNEADEKLNECAANDKLCFASSTNDTKQCFLDAMDCVTNCVDELERKLKE